MFINYVISKKKKTKTKKKLILKGRPSNVPGTCG